MKLLVLSSRFPLPLEKGDKLRLFHQIKFLSTHHEVILVSLIDDQMNKAILDEMKTFCSKIYTFRQRKWEMVINSFFGLFYRLPTNVGYFYNVGIRNKIWEVIEDEKPDGFFVQLIRMAPYLPEVTPQCASLDYMDSFSLRSQRRVDQGGLNSLFWQMESKLLQRYEERVSKLFGHKFIISEVDLEHLQDIGVSDLTLLRNGVDTTFFHPGRDSQKPYDLLLVGNMSYHPNIQAAKYLVQEIAIPLKKEMPSLSVLIAGATPTAAVRALESDWVTVSGYMPDIRDAYNSAKIFVAPIFSGSGLQNKILEAMAMQLPCVTTSLVNDSIGAPQTMLVEANDGPSFCHEIRTLLEHRDLIKMGQSGRSYVERHFGWSDCNKPLKELGKNETVI